MSRMTIFEGNSNDKDNIRVFMVKGERGYSAYDLYVQNGGTLTEEEWLDAFLNANNFYDKTEVDNLLTPKANTADLATVATSGSYEDLSNKPTIPSVNNAYSESTTEGYSSDYINDSVGVVESGHETHYDYVKLEDGTMILHAELNLTFIATTQSGALYSGSVELGDIPVPFVDIPKVFLTSTTLQIIQGYIDNRTNSNFGILHFLRSTATSSSGYGAWVNVLAIGKWKATE